MRALFLAASENRWLRERGVRAPFVRRAVSRFMPGETFDDMLEAARALPAQGIHSVFTRLGENVGDLAEARAVADHYVEGVEKIRAAGLSCEPSVKPTQLGLDINRDEARQHLHRIAQSAQAAGNYLWIDMEQSPYVDVTLDLTQELRASFPGVGVCLQAYLHRTRQDLARMLKLGVGIRLVKGAYREPPAVALPAKGDVDANYLSLGRMMLDDHARGGRSRVVFGTHDARMIADLITHARSTRVAQGNYEFHMLYGIQREEQMRLAASREHVRVLIAYGTYWFPWYMRRLAERPANVWFVLKSVWR
ncbi:MAG TPA: proline dehydrogenase family protein [Vicinamibacterales bacterium]|nr:proline dehydrogenase family protein [Vicinamibacterales bacterium]